MTPSVFDPLKVGPIELPNRLAMAPVKTALGGTDGLVSERHIAYFKRRADGGVGLIIVEPMFIDPRGREHPRQLGLGYLPAQFLSPRTNRRGDSWGSEACPFRFIDEIVETVRATLGPDLALIARVSADEKVEGGLGIDDAAELGRRVAGQGVDALHVVTVLELRPDRVIVATGSLPLIPRIPGLDDPVVAADILTGRRPAGRRVLVLGGGLVGIELAEHLATEGREVVVVELLDDVARDMEPVTRAMTLKRLATLPVEILTRTRLLELESGRARVLDEPTDEERTLGPFDTVLVAVGHAAYDPLSTALRGAGVPVTTIGDAVRPGQVLDATRAGREAVVAAERR